MVCRYKRTYYLSKFKMFLQCSYGFRIKQAMSFFQSTNANIILCSFR